MKRLASLLLALLIAGSLAACAGAPKNENGSGTKPGLSTASPAPESGAASAAADGTVTVTSTLNGEEHEVAYPQAPKRVVSLAGFATEMLLALGLEDSIVGYAWQDNEVLPQYKETFEALTPLCDPGTDPGEEAVLAAQPDLVVSWASSSEDDYFSYQSLAKNGILSYGFACELEGATLESVYTDFLNLGKIFRVEDRAEALVNEMRARVEAVGKRVSGEEPVDVFVCDIGSTEEQAFTAGGGLVADILEKAGGRNIVQDVTKNWTRISWEAVAQADPDWIVIDYYTNAEDVDGTIKFLKTQPALKDLDAVKNERFVILGLTDISASERNDDTVELLASHFHPEG